MGWPCHVHRAGSRGTTRPRLKPCPPNHPGCHQPPGGTYAGVGQLVNRSENVSAVRHRDERSWLSGRGVADDPLSLHVHVLQLQRRGVGRLQCLLARPLVRRYPGIIQADRTRGHCPDRRAAYGSCRKGGQGRSGQSVCYNVFRTRNVPDICCELGHVGELLDCMAVHGSDTLPSAKVSGLWSV